MSVTPKPLPSHWTTFQRRAHPIIDAARFAGIPRQLSEILLLETLATYGTASPDTRAAMLADYREVIEYTYRRRT